MFFRALVRPYPLPMIKIKDRLYEVVNHTIIDMKYEMHNGRVINIENNEAYIKIQDGILVIKDLIDFDTKEKLSAGTILKMGQRLWK
jgi:methionyl-tRNA formyltransferase